jgi:hypothetical protein
MNSEELYNELSKILEEGADRVKASVVRDLIKIFKSGKVEDKLFVKVLNMFEYIWDYSWYNHYEFELDDKSIEEILATAKSLISEEDYNSLIAYLDEEQGNAKELEGTVWDELQKAEGKTVYDLDSYYITEWIFDNVSEDTSLLLKIKLGNKPEYIKSFARELDDILFDAEEENKESGYNLYIDFEG